MRILVVVDMQNDFINGSLGTDEAQKIVPAVVKKIKSLEKGDAVLITVDTHDKDYFDTLEGKKLPVKHCARGTDGWKINEEVWDALAEAGLKGVAFEFFEKPTFGCKELAQRWISPEDEIEVCGLCTDICVISNALLLRMAHPNTKITVDSNATAGVTSETKEAALTAMRMCQIDVI